MWRDVLGQQLRSLRHARGETLAETAARAGVSPQYLSEVERGIKEPSSEMVAAVAGALDTTLVDLTSGVLERLKARRAVHSAVSRPAGRPSPVRNAIDATASVGRPARGRRPRHHRYAAGRCRSSITWSTSPYSMAAVAVKTRSWSVSVRSRSIS